ASRVKGAFTIPVRVEGKETGDWVLIDTGDIVVHMLGTASEWRRLGFCRLLTAMLEVCGGGDPSWSKRYQGMPLWVFHGEADSVVPVSRAREMIRDLAESGHSPDLRYTEYPGVGHNSWTQTYKRDDVFDWLFSHQKR
ncbi:MAG: RsfS/YbeB/iojap family protein, partial [Rubripirellula sp.]